MSELTVTFQGTSAAVPTIKRGLSAITLQRGADTILFDCGEGTQRQMMKHTGLKTPRAIFITHAHGDHWTGLSGLLATLEMQDHSAPLPIYMHPNCIPKIEGVLKGSGSLPKFASVEPMDLGATVSFNKGTRDCFYVRPFETHHSSGSQGYVFEEPERPGRFDPSLATLSGIHPTEFKLLIAGETVKGLRPQDVIGPVRRGRKVVYTGDTAPLARTSKAADGADLLIHEGTFCDDQFDRARSTRHSTGRDAGKVAAAAFELKRLALTHFSPRVDAREVVRQAAEHFSPTVMATDGMQINIYLED